MKEIKTLANCADLEFLRQTNRIRKAVEKWLTVTDIPNIRKRMPKFEIIPEGMDKKQAEVIERKNEKEKQKQIRANIDDVFDAMFEEHPQETLEIIRLCCFVEPDDDSHKVTYYMKAFSEMLNSSEVLDFFTSLVSLAKAFGLTI